MKIYLAGKITKSGWRDSILEPGTMDKARSKVIDKTWPVMQRSVLGQHDYVGPYFIPNDSSDWHVPGFHGPDSHGVDAEGNRSNCQSHDEACMGYAKREVVDKCLAAVLAADVVFAWIDRPDLYGTLVELGFAFAHKKPIIIGGPEYERDLWFGQYLADYNYHPWASPRGVLEHWLRENARATNQPVKIDGYIYLLRSGDAYKIGRARSVDDRVKQISPVMPYPVEILHTIPSNNVVRAERELHQQFAPKRLKGEWFNLDERDVRLLQMCNAKLYDEQLS